MNALENSPHFSAGKRARAHGEPCQIPKRIKTPHGRQAWEAGWRWQDHYHETHGESPVEKEKRWAAAWDAMEKTKELILTK